MEQSKREDEFKESIMKSVITLATDGLKMFLEAKAKQAAEKETQKTKAKTPKQKPTKKK